MTKQNKSHLCTIILGLFFSFDIACTDDGPRSRIIVLKEIPFNPIDGDWAPFVIMATYKIERMGEFPGHELPQNLLFMMKYKAPEQEHCAPWVQTGLISGSKNEFDTRLQIVDRSHWHHDIDSALDKIIEIMHTDETSEHFT